MKFGFLTMKLFVVFFLLISSAYAQKGSISGKITDAETNKPLISASVTLHSLPDSTQITGKLSKEDGTFIFSELNFGKYYIKFSYVGYKGRIKTNINLSAAKSDIKMGEIKLLSESVLTSEVTVTAEKEATEYKFDKKVINVDKSMFNMGGSAVDILRNTPSVNVDVDGNVTLRGSSDIKIMIDGKTRSLTQQLGSTVLDMIPSNAIDQIEIITNPSARYEAEGSSGIINIVLKKDRASGINGSLTVNAGTGDKYGGSANLNYNTGAFNFFLNYSFRNDHRGGYGNMSREMYYQDTTKYLIQNGDRSNFIVTNQINPGMDFTFWDYNRLSLAVDYHYSDRAMGFNAKYNQYDNFNTTPLLFNNYNKEPELDRSFDLDLGYHRTFEKKGRELNASFMYSTSNEDESSISLLQYTSVPVMLPEYSTKQWNAVTLDKNVLTNYQLDYIEPFSNGFRIETGYKVSIRNLDDDFNYFNYDFNNTNWNVDNTKKNHFLFDEQVHAVYGIVSDSIKNFRYQAGLRGEYTITKGNQQVSNETFEKQYPSWFPTIHLSYALTDLNKFNLSYTRRISRPSFHSLNPIVDYSDSLNLRHGNPKLNPQYIDSYEAGMDNNFEFISLNTTAFYRQTHDMIAYYRTLLPNGVFDNTSLNIASGVNYGMEFVASKKFGSLVRLDADFSFFKNIITGSTPDLVVDNESFNWTGRLNASINPTKDLSFQVTGSYRSPSATAQGTRFEMYFLDLGGKWDIFNRKFQIFARLSDVFNTSRFRFDNNGTNFISSNEFHRESRILTIGVTYRINNNGRQQEKKRNGDMPREDENYDG